MPPKREQHERKLIGDAPSVWRDVGRAAAKRKMTVNEWVRSAIRTSLDLERITADIERAPATLRGKRRV